MKGYISYKISEDVTLPKGHESFFYRNPEITLILIGFICIGLSVVLGVIWIAISMIPFGLAIFMLLKTRRFYRPPPYGYKRPPISWKKILFEGLLATPILRWKMVNVFAIWLVILFLVLYYHFFR